MTTPTHGAIVDELPALPPVTDERPLSAAAKLRAKMMREDAERKRIAALCDCDPEDIDLARINPVLD